VEFSVKEVQVAVKIMNVWGLNALNECFKAELRVCSRWKVPEAQKKAVIGSLRADGRQRDSGWVPDWAPKFSVWGCVEQQNGMREYEAYREDPGDPNNPGFTELGAPNTSNVWVEGMEWFTVVVTKVFELQNFPSTSRTSTSISPSTTLSAWPFLLLIGYRRHPMASFDRWYDTSSS